MRRAEAGVLGGEPFFRVLREQHPDVDLVILPPVDAPDPDQVLASVDDVVAHALAARRVLDALLGAIDHPGPDSRRESWRIGTSSVARTFVVRASLRGLAEGEALPLLRSIGDTLLAQGWDARRALDREAGIVAGDGDHLLDAQVVATSIDLRLDSRGVTAAPETIDAAVEVLR